MNFLNTEFLIIGMGFLFALIAITGGGFKTKWFTMPNHIGLTGRIFSVIMAIICCSSLITSFVYDMRIVLAPTLEKSVIEEVVVMEDDSQSFKFNFIDYLYAGGKSFRKQVLVVPENMKIDVDLFGEGFELKVSEVEYGKVPLIWLNFEKDLYLIPMSSPKEVDLELIKENLSKRWKLNIEDFKIKIIIGVNEVDAIEFTIIAE